MAEQRIPEIPPSADRVLTRLPENFESGTNNWRAPCPSHGGESGTTFAVTYKEDEKATYVYCHGGCTQDEVLAALGLDASDLYDEPKKKKTKRPRGRLAETYDYTDATGETVFQVEKYVNKAGEKTFLQRSPNGSGGWIYKVADIDPVLYRLPEVLQARLQGETILVVEGEKDVNSARKLGFTATTAPGGAGKWRESHSQELRGADVVFIPDNDVSGQGHVNVAARLTAGIAKSVKVLKLTHLPEKSDLTDWTEAGGTAANLRQLIDDAPLYVEEYEEEPPEPVSLPWPVMHEAAYAGIFGDIVRLIDRHTEADPVAVLINTISAVGNALGRGAFMRVGATKHHANLFCGLVGTTAKGRKGSSWPPVKDVIRFADEYWTLSKVANGLASGEGLIAEIQDPTRAPDKDGNMKIINPGVKDKRVLVMEGELAQGLKVMKREGNTLSPIMRNAYDGETLRTMVKHSPLKATDPHVSVVGHITVDELLRHLAETEVANGLANRFMWFLVKRSKSLPFGGEWNPEEAKPLANRLQGVITFGQKTQQLKWSNEARAVWVGAYELLTEDRPGMFGAVTARAEAQTLRLAMLYAIADLSHEIKLKHVTSALAVWGYAEESAQYIFGNLIGDPDADKIMAALADSEEGYLTRKGIIELFGRNKRAEEIDRIKGLLIRTDRIKVEREREGNSRKPTEKWYPK